MLMVEENHASGSRTTQSDNRIGPVGVGDEVDWHATVAADKSRKEGTKVVPIVVPDPPLARGVKASPETGRQRPY